MPHNRSIDYPLSNEDIHNAILELDHRGANIKDDKIITANTNIEDVFSGRGHTILYHGYSGQNIGHWYCLTRDGKDAFIFDSLGKGTYNKEMKQFLLNNGIKNIINNKKKYQSDTSSVCGRWCYLIVILRKKGLNIDQIYKYIETMKKHFGSYDKGVLQLTI